MERSLLRRADFLGGRVLLTAYSLLYCARNVGVVAVVVFKEKDFDCTPECESAQPMTM